MTVPGIEERRRMFPCGLEQPEGSYRFGADALALAEIVAGLALPETTLLCELGTGCGAAAFSVLLSHPRWSIVGLEKEEALCKAAVRNAEALGFGGRFRTVHGNAGELSALQETRAASEGLSGSGGGPLFDVVFCNPPWKVAARGRMSQSRLRRGALFGVEDTLGVFFTAADRLLKSRGLLVALVGSDRTADMLAALPCRLRPEKLLFLLPRLDADATWAILIARKNGRAALKIGMKVTGPA